MLVVEALQPMRLWPAGNAARIALLATSAGPWVMLPGNVEAQTAGLAAAYAMDEGAGSSLTDHSGNGNVGTLLNGPVWTTGRHGGALQFDGTDDRVRIPDANSLDLTTAATFEAWVYPTAAPSGWRTILQKEVEAYFFCASGGESRPVAGGTVNSSCCPQAVAPAALAANTWTHVAATYDGSQLRLYINGAQVASRPTTGAFAVNALPLWMGGNAVYGEHFRGKLDDVRVYGRALSAAEVQTDMNTPVAGGAPAPDTAPPSTPAGLTASPVSPTQINLAWSASTDNVGVAGYHVFRGGTQVATAASTSYADTGRSPNTSYSYQVRAADAAGNVSPLSAAVSATTFAAPDTTAPQVSITSPGSDALVNGVVTVTANASDNVGVTGVRLLVDGAEVGGEDVQSPYAFSWDTRTAANGAHTLAARARDGAGNTTTSAAVTVNVSNTSYFQNEIVVSGLNLPTTIEFLPDGRMLIVELGGKIWILPPGATAVDPVPFLQISNMAPPGGAQGLMDMVLDPDFANNRHYYVFYTAGSPNRDRLSRFTANAGATGTVAGSEVVLYQDPLNAGQEHHGGALNFGNDGKLYVTTGEHFTSVSQSLTTPRGKILRLNKDGTIPPDNPFHDGAGPNVDSIWARGLRNPFRAFYDAPTGRLYIADVGGNDHDTSQEEVNLGVAGANYGWPNCEGPCGNPAVTDPIYSYPHLGRDASITGGFIYRGNQFPSEYHGNYFFADYAQNWIRRLTFDASGNVSGVFNFEPIDGSLDGPYGDIVDVTQGPDGALYYTDLGFSDVTHETGVSKIRRIRFIQTNLPPVAVVEANPTEGAEPLTVSFSSAGSSDPESQPLSYAWTFGDGGTSTEANPVYTYMQTGGYTARLTVSDGVNTTLAAPVSITVGNEPTATIVSPADEILFRAGDVIAFSGTATDTEDGPLPPSAFAWSVDFLHDGHIHPVALVPGVQDGTFTIPTSGHDFAGNTRYRITLTVTDSDGLTATSSVVIYPEKVSLSFATEPAGLTLHLDGIARVAPFVRDSLINFTHTIEARNQAPYGFSSWSDGGAQQHTLTVPSAPQSYAATYTVTSSPPPAGLVAAWGFNEGAGTTAADASGNGNSGALVNGPTWTTGKTGGALLFDGSDDRVRVADSNPLDVTTAATFEAWAYPTAAPSGWRTILQKEVEAYFFCASGGESRPVTGGTFGSSCCPQAVAPAALPVNTWTHVAGTYDGLQLRLFINGTQVASVPRTGSYQVSTGALWIGGNAIYGEHFRGKLDDVRIYNRALTPAEIQQDMAAGIP
jgi:glucose/arabinose dehydrogenase/PKD repeat protein